MAMNMSDIARLAAVRRPVVSMWRSRYSAGRHAFPAPLPCTGDHGAVLFDDDEVVAWLQETGRGNNAAPAVERPLHSTALASLAEHADEASALILLHHVAQSPLVTLSSAEVEEALMMAQIPPEVLPFTLDLDAPRTADLIPHVDAVVEAAFSAEEPLARLVETFRTDADDWGAAFLTSPARSLLAAVLTEVRSETDLPLVPTSVGALALLVHALPQGDSGAGRQVTALPRLLRTPRQRAAWRLLAARGHQVSVLHTLDAFDDGSLVLPGGGCLAVVDVSSAGSDKAAAEELDDVLLALGPQDRALALGPAPFLTGREGRHLRGRLLQDAHASGISLRYAARLAPGMHARSIRRRLAVWVLAGRDSVTDPAQTVTADHGDARLTDGVIQAVAADMAVVMSGDPQAIHDHAFRAGGPLASGAVREAEDITAPRVAGGELRMGADLLAEAQHADADLMSALAPRAFRDARAEERVTWSELTSLFGADIASRRIPGDELVGSGPGTVAAIGAEEIRGTAPWGARRIDRLRLEEVAPRARFTEPGDVLYVSAGGPAAVVDDVGGHLVLAPARVFRAGTARRVGEGLRQAVPGLVAADIADQRVPDKGAWRIRVALTERAADIEALRREAAARRAVLRDRLERLDRAESALLQGLTTGTVRLAARAAQNDGKNRQTTDEHGAPKAASAGDEER